MMRCKGLCDSIPTFNRYTNDSKFCGICQKHLKIKNIGPRCPCCRSLFRTKRRWIPKQYTDSLLKRQELMKRY